MVDRIRWRDDASRRSAWPRGVAGWTLAAVALLVLALGVAMAVLGRELVSLGGTSYYLMAGVASAVAAVAMLAGRARAGLALYAAVVAGTLAWSLVEIAGKDWPHAWGVDLAGRVGLLAGLLYVAALAHWAGTAASRRGGRGRALRGVASATIALLVAIGAVLAAAWHGPGDGAGPLGAAIAAEADRAAGDDVGDRGDPSTWSAYGGTNHGRRFSTASQITPANVARLEPAWTFRTGETAPEGDRVFFSMQNTPLKVGDTLYVCSARNVVFALDPATGAERWRFDPKVPESSMESLFSVACRSVGYHDRTPDGATGPCARSVFVATHDGRLIALDAALGAPCEEFGEGGTVDLKAGFGETAVPGFASSTSGPAVVRDRVIVGQQVSDNQRRDAPSGVVRAFDARTGELVWAWDARRTDRPREPLAEGETWPEGTPNVWTVISADDEAGLVYLATGNAANDHFGGDRNADDDRFTAAVVAVDVDGGETRWHFATVDHDLWDYDLGAQPTVAELEIDGRARRVVIQGTKTGSIFVLDAAGGQPLRPVERRPAPQGGVPGERVAPAQPQSTSYPNFSGRPGPDPERIDARHAFGLTPIDAAMCRIEFHRMRYDGIYTPPIEGEDGILLMPGTIGGLNWGGVALDADRGILVTNHSRLANRVVLVPRDRVTDPPVGDGGARPDQEVAPQAGAPWGVDRPMWLSPLGVPCIAPPWGYLSATDLASGRLLWTQPLGTGFDVGPLGVATRLKLRTGTPNVGGAVATRSGLVFVAAAQDDFLRAFETRSGRLLWEGRLPAGGQASPMTYVHEGRQYVVIAAGGHARLQTTPGDHVVAFALPADADPARAQGAAR